MISKLPSDQVWAVILLSFGHLTILVCPSLLPGTDKASGPIGISLTLTPPTSSGKPEPPPVPFVTAVDDLTNSSSWVSKRAYNRYCWLSINCQSDWTYLCGFCLICLIFPSWYSPIYHHLLCALCHLRKCKPCDLSNQRLYLHLEELLNTKQTVLGHSEFGSPIQIEIYLVC